MIPFIQKKRVGEVLSKLTGLALLAGAALCLGSQAGRTADVNLQWNAVTLNEDGSPITDLAGYRVFYATTSFKRQSVFVSTVQAMADTSIQKVDVLSPAAYYTLTLVPGDYFFRLTAYDLSGNQSGFNVDPSGQDVEISTSLPPALPTVTVPTSSQNFSNTRETCA